MINKTKKAFALVKTLFHRRELSKKANDLSQKPKRRRKKGVLKTKLPQIYMDGQKQKVAYAKNCPPLFMSQFQKAQCAASLAELEMNKRASGKASHSWNSRKPFEKTNIKLKTSTIPMPIDFLLKAMDVNNEINTLKL